jgi:serine/threonine protein phosphatase PrpC
MRYGISSMQGWRRSMEDSHISSLDIGDGVAIFGVFDGHGGTVEDLHIMIHYRQ